jgi:hypothetical protein
MGNNLKIGGNNDSALDLTALQSLKRFICLTPRMLTASEIKSLRQSEVEVAKRVSELERSNHIARQLKAATTEQATDQFRFQ